MIYICYNAHNWHISGIPFLVFLSIHASFCLSSCYIKVWWESMIDSNDECMCVEFTSSIYVCVKYFKLNSLTDSIDTRSSTCFHFIYVCVDKKVKLIFGFRRSHAYMIDFEKPLLFPPLSRLCHTSSSTLSPFDNVTVEIYFFDHKIYFATPTKGGDVSRIVLNGKSLRNEVSDQEGMNRRDRWKSQSQL